MSRLAPKKPMARDGSGTRPQCARMRNQPGDRRTALTASAKCPQQLLKGGCEDTKTTGCICSQRPESTEAESRIANTEYELSRAVPQSNDFVYLNGLTEIFACEFLVKLCACSACYSQHFHSVPTTCGVLVTHTYIHSRLSIRAIHSIFGEFGFRLSSIIGRKHESDLSKRYRQSYLTIAQAKKGGKEDVAKILINRLFHFHITIETYTSL
jgi:hypothetical protein